MVKSFKVLQPQDRLLIWVILWKIDKQLERNSMVRGISLCKISITYVVIHISHQFHFQPTSSFQFMGGLSYISLLQFQTLLGALGLTTFIKPIISIIISSEPILFSLQYFQNTFIFYTYYQDEQYRPMKAISISSIASPHSCSSLEAIKNQGLPNFRNTCYINSNIQFLYSSLQLQDFLRKSAQNMRMDSIVYRLNEVFRIMSEGASLEEKEKSLLRLIRQIWISNKDLNFNCQQDSFQILIIMLNQMSEQDPRIQELFEIQLQNSCLCSISRLNALYLDSSMSICLQCRNKIHSKVLNYSNLLIIKAEKDETIHKRYYKQIGQKVVYKCIGRVFYIGDQQQGHYRASRIYGNQFIEFSDLDAFLEFDISPYFLLYQKTDVKINLQKHSGNSNQNPIMVDQIKNNSHQVVKMIDEDDQLANKPAIPTNDVPEAKIIMNQDIKFAENTEYQARIFINSPVVDGKPIKFCRKIYFNFIVTTQQSFFLIEMKVKNQVQLFNHLNPRLKVPRLQMKTPKLHVSFFLQSYEKNIKSYIYKIVQRHTSEEQFDIFFLKMESMLAQLGEKQIPERLITITRNL